MVMRWSVEAGCWNPTYVGYGEMPDEETRYLDGEDVDYYDPVVAMFSNKKQAEARLAMMQQDFPREIYCVAPVCIRLPEAA